jgi:hypothetical protein
MDSSIAAAQARGLRTGAYLAFLIAGLSSLNWISTLRQDYVMEHQWPAAPATVHSMNEESRKVEPVSSSGHSYWVYWMEFLVVLDLPQSQCPGRMIALTSNEEQCTGTVKTPKYKSRADATAWHDRHPPNSRLMVHYDPQSGQIAFAGESIFNIYPWDKIGTTAVILVIAAALFIAARRRLASQESTEVPQTQGIIGS